MSVADSTKGVILAMMFVCVVVTGLIYTGLPERTPIEPVHTSKLKVEEWTCLNAKTGECLKWEVKEVYRD